MISSPVGYNDKKIKGIKKSYDSWQVENAMQTIMQANALRKDKDLMKAVAKMAKERLETETDALKLMKSIASE